MSLPDAASLEAFSLAELREVVGRLVGEVHRLHSGNVALQARVDAQQVTITALRAESQALRDEVARLKSLPPRPPSRPSGMEQATQPGAADKGATRPKLPRGVKRDAQAITAERVLRVAVPAGSRFKGYEDILVRDLHLSAEVVRYRRERWLLPSGETVLAALPAGIVGGFGPELRRFVLALHAQGQVTTERLVALLNGIGVEFSKRQVVRLLTEPLDGFVAEDQEVLRAGLATARWITVDDTAAARAQGRVHHADRRRPLHRVPDRPVEVARGVPVYSARRTHGLRRERGGAGLHAWTQPVRTGGGAVECASGPAVCRHVGVVSAFGPARRRHACDHA